MLMRICQRPSVSLMFTLNLNLGQTATSKHFILVDTGVVYLLKFIALELKAVFQIDVADF